jgi:hypothetical protein
MQQILELMKSMIEEITHGVKMEANTKSNLEIMAGQEQMKESMERQMGSPVSRMEADRKPDRDEIREEMKSGQTHMRSRVDAWTTDMKDGRKEMTAYNEATEADTEKTEPGPGMRQFVGEHHEVPKEEAAVIPVGGLRKRRRDQDLAAGRSQKPKRRIQVSCESRKRLTVAGRKMTHQATVAWRKRNSI